MKEVTKLLVVVLAGALMFSAIYVALAYGTGVKGQWEWTYGEAQVNSGSQSYLLHDVAEDGTVYVQRSGGVLYDGVHYTYLQALNDKGKLQWQHGVNGVVKPVRGEDDRTYFVDIQDARQFEGWTYGMRINMTVLNPDGSDAYHYLIDHGSITLLGVYPDGQAVIESSYYSEMYAAWHPDFDDIIGLDRDGSVLWKLNWTALDCGMVTGQTMMPNGTLVLHTFKDNTTYDVGLTEDGTVAFKAFAGYQFFWMTNGKLVNGTVAYVYWEEAISNTTKRASVRAMDTFTGKVEWEVLIREELGYSGLTVGFVEARPATAILSNGTIIWNDPITMRAMLFSPDGAILWTAPGVMSYIGTTADGTMVFYTNPMCSSLVGVDGHMNVLWELTTSAEPFPGLFVIRFCPDGGFVGQLGNEVVKYRP